jgi:DNA topoisomerase-1
MDRVFIRVGGERYRRENGSFGATTLRAGHVNVEGSEIKLDFRGKSGKRHQLELNDKRVASVVRKCLDLPGETLFQYREDDEVRSICASDVNEYLKQISGSTVTSKDFRTWGGTACAAAYLAGVDLEASTPVKRAHIRQAVKAAARVLGNTPTVCRRSYIHPVVLASYEEGRAADPIRIAGLRVSERVVLSLLKRQRTPTTATRERGTRKAQPVAEMTAA